MAKYLLAVNDINWLAILALLTFFFVFTVALVLVFFRKPGDFQEVSEQPLVDSYAEDDKSEQHD